MDSKPKQSATVSEPQPSLETDRLILRPFDVSDGETVENLAGDKAIAASTCHIPHPYPTGDGAKWILTHRDEWIDGKGCVFAVVLKSSDSVMGACGVVIDENSKAGTLGYWIGVPFQGQGYATEAVYKVIDFVFSHLEVKSVIAEYYSDNEASKRVMEKCGMKYEGTVKNKVKKWGVYKDVGTFSILRTDWEKQRV